MIDLRAFLPGTWQFARTVTGGHVMQGAARFEVRPGGLLHYREDGLATPNGSIRPLRFSRSYLYQVDRQTVSILFDEQPTRLFQDLELVEDEQGWIGFGLHLCGADTYRSQYRFGHDGSFRIEHAVSGPRKDYVIVTDYIRDDAAIEESKMGRVIVEAAPC